LRWTKVLASNLGISVRNVVIATASSGSTEAAAYGNSGEDEESSDDTDYDAGDLAAGKTLVADFAGRELCGRGVSLGILNGEVEGYRDFGEERNIP